MNELWMGDGRHMGLGLLNGDFFGEKIPMSANLGKYKKELKAIQKYIQISFGIVGTEKYQ